jgi:hypothetical protein
MSGRGSGAGAALAWLVLATSACFDGGDYRGGGRRIEAPGMVDVAEDALDDATPSDDASLEDGDVSSGEDVAVTDASLDPPRDEPPPDVEDAGQGEAEGPRADIAPDLTPVDVRSEGPPSSADVSEPKDTAADIPPRDVPGDPRRD